MKEFISIHIKICRGNFFIIISNKEGKLLFTKNSGNLGYKHITKRSTEALNTLLNLSVKYILSIKEDCHFFIQFEGTKKNYLQEIRKKLIIPLINQQCVIVGFKIRNKIAHNGCRSKK